MVLEPEEPWNRLDRVVHEAGVRGNPFNRSALPTLVGEVNGEDAYRILHVRAGQLTLCVGGAAHSEPPHLLFFARRLSRRSASGPRTVGGHSF